MTNRTDFRAHELHADGELREARFELRGSPEAGWELWRNEALHLRFGVGYRVLRSRCCGICSTDLDRHRLPFPLPQVTGHEVVASDDAGRRFAVEINASHAARGVESDCPFCQSHELARHCPQRLVLGIHDLPGGFGPWILAPSESLIELPDELPDDVAVLIEPFAAALRAVECVSPRSGDTVAVLGPRRLGLLVVAALAAFRRESGRRFEVLALARRPELRALARDFGADEARSVGDSDASRTAEGADVVIDTTGHPDGSALGLGLARRELHLKSTHGQPALGLVHATELVVDEISVAALPDDPVAGAATLSRMHPPGTAPRLRIAWLASGEPPRWLSGRAELLRADRARQALATLEASSGAVHIARADAVVAESAAGIDEALRPRSGDETSLVRPGGAILLLDSERSRADGSLAVEAVRTRDLRISSSRCGDFRAALALLQRDPTLAESCRRLVTHRFDARALPEAFRVARSHGCIKAVVRH